MLSLVRADGSPLLPRPQPRQCAEQQGLAGTRRTHDQHTLARRHSTCVSRSMSQPAGDTISRSVIVIRRRRALDISDAALELLHDFGGVRA